MSFSSDNTTYSLHVFYPFSFTVAKMLKEYANFDLTLQIKFK